MRLTQSANNPPLCRRGYYTLAINSGLQLPVKMVFITKLIILVIDYETTLHRCGAARGREAGLSTPHLNYFTALVTLFSCFLNWSKPIMKIFFTADLRLCYETIVYYHLSRIISIQMNGIRQ